MNKLSAGEQAGRVVLRIFRCNGIQPGQMMLFPAISAQFLGANPAAVPAPSTQNPDRPGHHRWSHLHAPHHKWPDLDLAAGIEYLLQRGYLTQGLENRIAYFLTDAGSAAPSNQE